MSDVIFLDMDETLVNLVDPWLAYLNEAAGTDHTRENTTAYSIEDTFEHLLSRTKIFKPFKTYPLPAPGAPAKIIALGLFCPPIAPAFTPAAFVTSFNIFSSLIICYKYDCLIHVHLL